MELTWRGFEAPAVKRRVLLFSPCAVLILLVVHLTISQAFAADSGSKISFVKSDQTLGDTRSFGFDIGDVDLDGDVDVFIANYIGPSRLWLNDGHGHFTMSEQVFSANGGLSEAHDAAMGDLNGDRYPDIFVIFHNKPSRVFLNDGTGQFRESGQDIGGLKDYPQTVQLADVDGDGDLDAMIYNYKSTNSFWYNDGTGQFKQGDVNYGGDGSKGNLLVDLTNDSLPDMYIIMRSEPNPIWINQGDGTLVFAQNDLDSSPECVQSGDVDGDGDTDLILVEYRQMIIRLNQNHTGTFQSGSILNDGGVRATLFDADGDGDLDIATAHRENGNTLWINDGHGSFKSLGTVFGMERSFGYRCCDLDGDGDLDVVMCQAEGTGGNSIYFNETK